MADTQRERIIANPARKRGRTLTAKQLKYFGTKRQRAAARVRRRPRRSHAHRENAGHIVGYTIPNRAGKKGKRKMAKAKANRKRANAGRMNTGRPRRRKNATHRRNPGGHRHRAMARRYYRRNPGGESLTNIVTNAIFVIAGALGSKLLTQMVLGANNVGLIGYAGNAIVGGLMWFATEKIMHNKTASNGVIAGTAVQIILRLINDYTPFGQYVSQLGMGDYQAQSFVTPQVLVDPYNSAQIRIPGAWMPPPPPPAPATTVSGATAKAGIAASGMGDLYGGRSSLY
jgi:hypothetical protein